MADGNSGSGWGWFWLILVIALIGGGYLYQREGGKVFGPDGVVGPKKPPEPPRLTGFQSKWDTGAFSHDLLLVNQSAGELKDVSLTIKFYREDGKTLEEKRFWAIWQQGETKRVNVPSHRYQKHEWRGTALRGFEKVTIDDIWDTTWK
jgi:hypothetical protein